MTKDFKYIEKTFLQIISNLTELFNTSEIQEVQDFLNVGEYGLALETLLDIVDEENKSITENVVSLVKNLAEEMNVNINNRI